MKGRASKSSNRSDGYIRKEAAEITQIPARTIQYYTDRGFVTPEVAAPTGRGTTRRYSLKNLVELSFVKELSEHGYTLEKIKGIMDVVRGRLSEYWYKSIDIAKVTDLCLVLLSPSTKRIKVQQVQLCRKGDIYLDEIIGKRSFSVIRLEGIILKILKAGIGTEKYRAYSALLGRSKVTGYSKEEVARIFEE